MYICTNYKYVYVCVYIHKRFEKKKKKAKASMTLQQLIYICNQEVVTCEFDPHLICCTKKRRFEKIRK